MKRNNRLFFKVFIFIFLNILTLFIIFASYSIVNKKESYFTFLSMEALNILQSIKLATSPSLIKQNDTELLEFNLDFIKENKMIKTIIITKKDKSHLIITQNNWFFSQKLDKSLKDLEIEKNKSIIFTSPILKKKVFHFTYPVKFSGLNWGYMHISLDLGKYNKNLMSLYMEYFYLLLGVIFISIFASYNIAKVFTRPIIRLNDIAKKISTGDLNSKVDIKRDDEIGELANTFNIMLSNLKSYQRNIENSRAKLELRVIDRTKDLNEANEKLALLNNNLDLRIKTEINKRKEQEELLLQQSRLAAMGEMINMIAHQWRQPLNTIGVLIQNLYLKHELDLLSKDDFLKDKDKAYLLIQKMSTTIDDFRDYFKPDKKKKEFELSNVISKTLHLMESSFVYNNIKIEFVNEKKLYILGLENELSQVLLNILSNSKDAIIENKIEVAYIQIELYEKDLYNYICISDNAGGIKEDIINRVFEPYFSTKSEKNGTGIGLYMSKIIIENSMHGELSVKNIYNGARFIIKIPKIK